MRLSWQTLRQGAVWELAFRPLFLCAAALAVVAMLVWLAWLDGVWPHGPARLSPLLWHVHEMLFGFGFTVAAGFLLTAVQNWTGLRSLNGSTLMVLVGLWLLMRVLLWLPVSYGFWWLVQGSWWLLVLGCFGRLLWRANSRRNYLLLPVLLAVAVLNLAYLYQAQHNPALALHLAKTVLLLFGLVIGVIGGRVIPLFTRNAVATARVLPTPRTDVWLLVLAALTAVLHLLEGWVSLPVKSAHLMIVIAHLHLFRLGHWGGWSCGHNALLWSLHLAYLALALGLAGLGFSTLLASVYATEALHLITVGALGLLILSMMGRVSLGHTGRPLLASRRLCLALWLLVLATLLRVLLPVLGLAWWGWNLSALCWSAAFLLFVQVYLPILTAPRWSPLR